MSSSRCIKEEWGAVQCWLIAAVLVGLLACSGKKRDFADGTYMPEGTGLAGASGMAGEVPAETAAGEPSTADEDGLAANENVPLVPAGAVLGAACARDQECASGFCTDGVCCEARCGELCATCAAPGAEGSCGPASSDAACGALACAGGTECRGYDQSQLEQNCAAFGECRPGVDCAPLDQPEGTLCQEGTGTCNGLGECVVPGKALLGAACTLDEDCGEGHCVAGPDGTSICCDAACDGLCEQCSASGRCTEAPPHDERCAAVDCPADNVCRDYPDALTDNLCRGFGQCRTALDCPANALRVDAACECDAAGACNLVRGQACSSDAECGAAACAPAVSGENVCCSVACGGGLRCSTDGTRCVECEGEGVRCEGTTELRCGGDALTSTNCANGCTPGVGCNTLAPVGFSCQNVACQDGAVCQSDVSGARRCCARDCGAEGKVCAENGSCVCPEGVAQGSDESCLLQLGEPCGTGTAACEAGLTCVDGVCCAEDCSGACESCNVPGNAGRCSYAPQDTSACGAGEVCAARGQCRLQPGGACGGNDTRCLSNNCEPQLNGNGATVCCAAVCDAERPFCSRDGGRCVECESNADCPNGCQNGVCLPLRPLGQLCDVDAQCDSGECTRINGTNTSRCCGQCQGGQVCNATGQCECPPGQVPVNGQCRKMLGQTCASGLECQTGNCEAAVDGQSRCCAGDCGDPAVRRCGTDGAACIDQRGGVGEPCDSNADCVFGNCFDGVCCDGPCGGVCERCNAAGQCIADSSPTGCPPGLQCFGRGLCRVPLGGECGSTTCGEGFCIDVTTGGGRVCCSDDCPGARPFCAPGGNTCLECAEDSDCDSTELCDQGRCVQQLSPPETSCASDAECATPPCIETFLDIDGDGFALAEAVNSIQRFCTRAPAGRTTRRPINQQTTDCCDIRDGGANFRPNQTVGSSTPLPACAHPGDPEGFDRNCSGAPTATLASMNRERNCISGSGSCTDRSGWVPPTSCGLPDAPTIPACGDLGCIASCQANADGSCTNISGGRNTRGPCL